MKFLYVEDSGYWKIAGDHIENEYGGRSSYRPSSNDKIVEYDSWADMYKATVRDDSQTTGWISPSGDFFGCAPQDHRIMALYYFGEDDERDLERKGYIKISETPARLRAMNPNLPLYEYGFKMPTSAQWDVLVAKGIVEE